MRTHLTNTLLLLFTTLVLTPCFAQQESIVTFNYDANGNRITRSISIRRVVENGKDIESDSQMQVEAIDIFANTKVSIFPNPTKNKVYLFVESDEEEHMLQMRLANSVGIVIQEKYLKGDTETIDLSNLSSGVYLLQLTIATEARVWKIIKN